MTKALILAAGRGERLRPLTDAAPKPLLPVDGMHLCDWQVAAAKRAGVTEIVMNTAHCAAAFDAMPTYYSRLGMTLRLSPEGNRAEEALESLGGIVKALPLLTDGTEPFFVLAGDVVHDFDLNVLLKQRKTLIDDELDAWMVAVPNPPFHTAGDLTVTEAGTVIPGQGPHTYGCILYVSPRIFQGLEPVRSKLFPWLWQYRLCAMVHTGFWDNVGTVDQYESLCRDARAKAMVRL